MTSLPTFTMRQLLEAGVHFGHHTRRWNPAMQPYLYGVRNGVHIIDLQQTVPNLYSGLEMVRDTVARGGRVLFVGTKRQAQDYVAEAAQRCGQYFINHRWMGGMLTNWRTISQSIKRLKQLEEQLESEDLGVTKKERLHLERHRDNLSQTLGGIKDMGGLPDLIFFIDTNREQIGVNEANKLGIPSVAICDSNTDPRRVSQPIPGNDDSLRAIELYTDLVARSALMGLQAEMQAAGADSGAADKPDHELEAQAIAEEEAADAAAAAEQAETAAATS